MRLGIGLFMSGPDAGPDAVSRVARRAEELGFDSIWGFDRLLYPLQPQVPYPALDGSLPELYKRVMDPLLALTFAAANTSRIAIGTSVLNLPWYNPVLLARSLATLDVLSAGRLRLGFGMGWSPDEYDAAGVPFKSRASRADDSLRALKAIWTTDPVEFQCADFKVSRSFIGLKPVQKPHPPIYMAAFALPALQRAAREADGWFPVYIPLAEIGGVFESVKAMVREAGRDADQFKLLIRGNLKLTSSPISKDRADFSGTLEQIAEDIRAARKLGADELLLDLQGTPEMLALDKTMKAMEEVRNAAG
jgi:probable F420-dependent oxidoreductase